VAAIVGGGLVLLVVFYILNGVPGFHSSREVGSISFGSSINDSIELIEPKTMFGPSDRFAMRAFLREPARAASLRWVVAKTTAAGSEWALIDQPWTISNPDFQIVGNEYAMSELAWWLDGPGTYVVRFYRDTTLLAEGRFELTE
jgi:hypothetical protein